MEFKPMLNQLMILSDCVGIWKCICGHSLVLDETDSCQLSSAR